MQTDLEAYRRGFYVALGSEPLRIYWVSLPLAAQESWARTSREFGVVHAVGKFAEFVNSALCGDAAC